MDNFGKPNFYGTYAGENTGEDILLSPHAGSSNSHQGTVDIVQEMYKINAPELSEKHYLQPAASSAVEECSFPPPADAQKAERKRKADKAYRERCKRQKNENIEQLATLGKENEELKTENQCLKKTNASLNQSLQSQTGELNKIKHHLHNLKHENEKQNALVQILSDLVVVNPDLCLQNKKLSDENARLREIVKLSLNDGAVKLMEENGRLRHEKLLLEVKIDALLGHMVYENTKNCGNK